MIIRRCKRCKSYSIPHYGPFCPNCGHRFPPMKSKPKPCPACGKLGQQDAKFCSRCGAELRPQPKEVPKEPEAPPEELELEPEQPEGENDA